jgi:asparagine synthase (glutamine-hydrolysing)
MRRLSVIDLKTGQQPIFSEDGSLVIVFNGEIYNYLEIKKDLESKGYRFRTNSDTETIVNAYREWGDSCLQRLRGMFAFAIWDLHERELFIARDRVGKKPLFYSLTSHGDFVFGSELKSLLSHGLVDRHIDLAAFDAYVTFGYVPEEFCIFRDVHKLAPGHFLKYKDGRVVTEKYWDFNYGKTSEVRSEKNIIEELRAHIEDAVRVRLISEVPLGAFLSGGVDSATVVAMMAKTSNAPVKTFSIGFTEDSFNELKFARIAAERFGTEHHEFIVTPDLTDIVDELVWHFDEPFADSSALPTYMVSKMAREHVTVVLSGDGGDELFAGYTRYVTHERLSRFERLPRLLRHGAMRAVSDALPHYAYGKNYLYNASLDPVMRYIDSVSQFNRPKKNALYSKQFQDELSGTLGAGEREFERFVYSVEATDSTEKLLYLDSKTYLPGDILTKVDRMSMANSLECRSPLLDHKLIEFVGGLPSKLKKRGSETKYILKKAMEGIVPDSILYRPKQGFGVPINDWINAQLNERIVGDLGEQRTLERGYFEKSYIHTLLKEHKVGRRDHSHQLWLLWMFELWHRKFIDVQEA